MFQSPDCNLHQINLGLWPYVLDCFTTFIKIFLQQAVNDRDQRVISDTAISEIWIRLGRRFALLERSLSGLSFSERITSFATDMQTRKAAKKSKVCVIQGREHFRLMMVSRGWRAPLSFAKDNKCL